MGARGDRVVNGRCLHKRVGALEERFRTSDIICTLAEDGEGRGDTQSRLGAVKSSCTVVVLSELDELI